MANNYQGNSRSDSSRSDSRYSANSSSSKGENERERQINIAYSQYHKQLWDAAYDNEGGQYLVGIERTVLTGRLEGVQVVKIPVHDVHERLPLRTIATKLGGTIGRKLFTSEIAASGAPRKFLVFEFKSND